MSAVIRTERLRRVYGSTVAVEGLDLSVEPGEIFGLLGPNGAGKTTTVGMLATLVRPTSGAAWVDGWSVADAPGRVRRSVGIVFQDLSLDTILTGRENLELSARLYGVPRAIRRRRIDELLDLVDLAARADTLVRTYSGGMKRRLELVRGLLHRPRVLFLDEPTLGLDPQGRRAIWEHIGRMREAEGTTIVLTTHYMEEAEAMCDRVAIIDRGRVILEGAPGALCREAGGDRVDVRGPAFDEAAIRALPFVRAFEPTEGGAVITVDRAARDLPALLAVLGPVTALEVHAPSLDDVFLRHTGRGLRDEVGDGNWMDDAMRFRVQGGR